jgi:LuxR family maltose regulon positive regulatory protein
MSAPLCDAVTAGVHSQRVLAQLDRANLFLHPLDDERRWYRYHHLFSDLLRSQLKQTRSEQEATLHRRASAWYAENGLITEAVRHALAGGDLEQAAYLVEGNALAMMGHGALTTVTRWLDALPEDMVRRRPWLSLARAWASLFAGDLGALEPLLQDAEDARQFLEPERQMGHLDGHVAAIRAEAAYVQGDMSRTALFSHEALDRLPAEDSMARGFAAAHLGYALYGMGDLSAADEALADAYAIARETGDSHVAVMILCDLTTVQIDRGQLHRAADSARAALKVADQHAGRRGQRPPSSGHAHSSLACVLLEWNDLATALECAQEGNRLCKLWRQPEILATSYANLARIQLALGLDEDAFEGMRQARRLAVDLPPWVLARVSAQEAVLRLAAGDLRAADRWARASGLTAQDRPSFQERFLYQALARVLVSLGRARSDAELLDSAVGLLSCLLEDADGAQAMGSVIKTLVLEAMALQALDRTVPALAALERALVLAQPEGYVRTFIDEGLPMGQLLRQALARGIGVDYVRELLDALESDLTASDSSSAAMHAALVEPLTERELEVLRLLSTHLSSTEMAQELIISVNTVRSHIKNIYGKLGVHSRGQAVARAQDLNLL